MSTKSKNPIFGDNFANLISFFQTLEIYKDINHDKFIEFLTGLNKEEVQGLANGSYGIQKFKLFQDCGEIQIPVVNEFRLENFFPKFSLSNGGYKIIYDNDFAEIKKKFSRHSFRLREPVSLIKKKILKSFNASNLSYEVIPYWNFLPILKYLTADLQPNLTIAKKQVCLSTKYSNVFIVDFGFKPVFFRISPDSLGSKRWSIGIFENYYEVSKNEFIYFSKK